MVFMIFCWQFHDGVMTDGPTGLSGAQMTLVSATKPSEMPKYLEKILEVIIVKKCTSGEVKLSITRFSITDTINGQRLNE